MTLKCLPCTDKDIEAGDGQAHTVHDAVTMAPLAQTFNANGQTIMAINVVPVCRFCRVEQLKGVSSRLAVA